jgi:hypothetical protein
MLGVAGGRDNGLHQIAGGTMRIGKILGVWGVLAGLMFWNGFMRIKLLQPLLGPEAGEMMSGFIGIILIFGATRPFLLEEPEQPLKRVARISALWVGLTIVFETVLGRLIGQSWSEMARTYAVWDGQFWPVILVAVGSAPFIWLRRTGLPIARVAK